MPYGSVLGYGDVLGPEGYGYENGLVGAAADWGAAMPALRAPAGGGVVRRPVMAAPAAGVHAFARPAALPPGMAMNQGPMVQLPQAAPPWREGIAPGVAMPGVGLEPLPLTPQQNDGVFTATVNLINFEARPQSPFRAERLLASVRRTGAAGVTIRASGIFVGRQLQQLELGEFDVEFFSPVAVGVRLNLVQAEPGMLIRIQCRAVPAVAGADTVAVTLMMLGHSIR